MTIALPILGTPDDIDTYDGLIEAIVSTLKDSTLEDHAPRFIYLAENMFNRRLYNLESEGTVTATAVERMALPADFKALRTIYIGSDPRNVLRQLAPDDLSRKWADASTGQPQNYALLANELKLGPAPDATYTVTLSYIRSLTHLSTDTQQNWLIEAHADLYFYSALAHAEFFGWNDERIPMIRDHVDTILAEINFADARRRRGDDFGEVAGSYF